MLPKFLTLTWFAHVILEQKAICVTNIHAIFHFNYIIRLFVRSNNKGMDMWLGGRGWRPSSKLVFYQKVCILDLWTVLFVLNWSTWTSISHTKPYQKISTFWFIRNGICNFKLFVSKCPNYGKGRGGPSQVWASKLFASIHA